MEHIMKYKTKSVLISNQIQYLKVNKKNIQNNNSINSGKVDENNMKFTNNRQFGNDLTISLKNGKQAQNQKPPSNNITQNQNKVNKTYLILIHIIDTSIYKKTFSIISNYSKSK
jgi:hypothetical protein